MENNSYKWLFSIEGSESNLGGFDDDYPSGVGPVRALIIDPAANRPYGQNNYLWPLPINEVVLNTELKQNLGW